jgi:hypothetical protein
MILRAPLQALRKYKATFRAYMKVRGYPQASRFATFRHSAGRMLISHGS